MRELYWFILAALATWRITHLLHAEDGPAKLVARLRALAGHGLVGNALDCFYCLSVWIALGFGMAIGDSWPERLLLWPALSAGAIMLERLSTPRQQALYFEDHDQKEES
jgi:hypothetical protein